jgi:hypothetical protein
MMDRIVHRQLVSNTSETIVAQFSFAGCLINDGTVLNVNSNRLIASKIYVCNSDEDSDASCWLTMLPSMKDYNIYTYKCIAGQCTDETGVYEINKRWNNAKRGQTYVCALVGNVVTAQSVGLFVFHLTTHSISQNVNT